MADVVVMNADAHGYGDACTTACVAEGSKHGPVKLVHYATGHKREMLELFGVEITDNPEGARKTFDAYHVEVRVERGTVPRAVSRGRFLGIPTPPKRPALRPLPLASIEWAAGVRDARTRGGERPFVVLAPQTNYRTREWPPAYWVDLAWRLEQLDIGTTFTLMNKDERFLNTPSYHWGYRWPHLIALYKAADLVIAIDSGPANVAGMVDAPTLALLGPTLPTIFALCPSVTCLAAPKTRIDCVGCYFGHPFRGACDLGCMALSRLFVEDVLAHTRDLLSRK